MQLRLRSPARPRNPSALEEIVVTADFREARIEELPISVSVLDRDELEATTQQHFEEAIRRIPNLNLSGEGSRARYFQLRGVGELEQYDGAPNPSIGFIVDDIDFSGLGSIATLFDIDRVEVLRGPQGTRYGANALGGLVYMRSQAPSAELAADFEATTGSDGTRALGAAVGGPLEDALGFRASVHSYENDGFRDNVFLRRDDTYGRDELTARGKLAWSPSDAVQVDFAGLYVDIDNGYDAWAIDNGFTTYSDDPGRDAQRSTAGSVRVRAELDDVDLVSITGFAETDAVFSFDADWGNAGVLGAVRLRLGHDERSRASHGEPGAARALEAGRDRRRPRRLARRRVRARPRRAATSNATSVVYEDPFCGAACSLDVNTAVASDYDATNSARVRPGRVVGLNDRLAAYGRRCAGSSAAPTTATATSIASRPTTTCSAARSRSIGGSPSDARRICGSRAATKPAVSTSRSPASTSAAVDNVILSPANIEFDAESLTSIEAGFRASSADGRLRADVGVFVARARRSADQSAAATAARRSVVVLVRDGATPSAASITASKPRVDWQRRRTASSCRPRSAGCAPRSTSSRCSLISRAASRRTRRSTRTRSARRIERTSGGGRGSICPAWTRSSSTTATIRRRSPTGSRTLSVGREWESWSVKLWARNVFDEDYFVRGFYFGNEPPDFPPTLYTRLGDPRHYGVTLSYRL